jgi:hypothetical protein
MGDKKLIRRKVGRKGSSRRAACIFLIKQLNEQIRNVPLDLLLVGLNLSSTLGFKILIVEQYLLHSIVKSPTLVSVVY